MRTVLFKLIHLRPLLFRKSFSDFFQEMLEEAYAQPASTDDYATDCLWYLWCGEGSSFETS